VHLIFSRIQKPLPSPNTWSAAAAMLAFVDIAIIGFGTVAILGVRILPGGVIDWSVVLDH
jgi:hypothetical protein